MNRIQTLITAIVLALAVTTSAMAKTTFPQLSQNAYGIAKIAVGTFQVEGQRHATSSFSHRYLKYIGLDFQLVDVRLRGWRFEYVDNDHELQTASLRIENVAYDGNGWLSFDIRGTFADQWCCDDFEWSIWGSILALKETPNDGSEWTIDTRGVCRDMDGDYPSWSGYYWSQTQCETACQGNANCQGFAMSTTRNYCQLFGSDGRHSASKLGTQITRGDSNHSQYTCYLKR